MITRMLQKLLKSEATGGILLLIAAAAAMIIANSSLHDWYHHFWHSDFTIGNMTESLHFWVNDALMVIFFFVVGLEIKREIMAGELSSLRQAMLPVVAALGGILVPIAIYFAMNGGDPEAISGWGIPMATDIAFAIGILSLLGSRAPLSLKVFLTAFAIVDDMGAVIVIAIFYSEKIGWLALGIAAALLLLLYIFGQKGVHNKLLFIVIGVVIWWLFLKSGVHTTIAGVLLALTLPLKSKIDAGQFSKKIEDELGEIKGSINKMQETWNHHQLEMIDKVKTYANKVTSPLQWFENNLHRFTMLVIMPIFAFANAGVYLGDVQGSVFEGVSLSIILGLVVGKLVGVFSFSWISVKLKLASLPSNSRWKDMVGIAMLGGVGFTMSLFIANLSFDNVAILDEAKLGILAASATAAVLGMLYLVIVLPKKGKS